MLGLIEYLYGPGKKLEHTNQHLIAGSLDFEDLYMGYTNLRYKDLQAMANLFNENNKLYKGPVKKHVYHVPLTIPKSDGTLTDEQWNKIAHDYVEKMGFHDSTGNQRNRQWFAVRHGLTDDGLDGVHLVINLYDEVGKKADLNWKNPTSFLPKELDFARSQRICRELEKQYGLHELESHKFNLETTRGVNKADLLEYVNGKSIALWKWQQKEDKTGIFWDNLTKEQQRAILKEHSKDYVDPFYIRHILFQIKAATSTESEFVNLARDQGLLLRPRYATGGKNNVTGYSVAIKPEIGKKPRFYMGGSVDKELSLTNLRKSWEPENAKKVLTEWNKKGQYKQFVGKTSNLRIPDNLLQDMQQKIDDFQSVYNERLIKEDPLALQTVLHQTSNFFYAYSQEYEKEYPAEFARMGFRLKKLEARGNYLYHDYYQKTRFFGSGGLSTIARGITYNQRPSFLGSFLVLAQLAINYVKANESKKGCSS
ncbi:MAG: relaxase/mobilization nuclease domain-containing protein [Bifidobacteriaceae bacterium]|nr:relaxase/mobilization nuclease domain-containing protein [Bifidobacteriaceae bacterium]